MALDSLLITQDDLKRYRPTAELDESRIGPYILAAQRHDLRPILGDALYLDFLKGYDSVAKYQELLAGKEYTLDSEAIVFEGAMPVIAHYALARFLRSNPVQIVRFGVVNKSAPQSEASAPALVNAEVAQLKSDAQDYANNLSKFLSNNTATYPLYNNGRSKARSTSLNFFKL